MSVAAIRISDLNREERRFVIRTFVHAVGAHEELTRLSDTNGTVRYEDVLGALNPSTWPTSEATEVELAWSSEPLSHPDFPRLQTYSVFWCSSSGLQLWIGTTPQRPREQSLFMDGPALIGVVMRQYRIEFSSQQSPNRLFRFVRRNWVGLLPYILLACIVIGAFAYSYFRRGFVPWTFILPMIAVVTFLCQRFGPRLLGLIAYDLVLFLAMFFGVPYLLWTPSEHLPYGSDTEYPFMAGLAAAMTLGFNVILLQAVLSGEEETLVEMFRTRFRSLRRSLALMSVITMAGYAAFLVHSYAIHQVFVEGNHFFVLLIIFGFVALYATVHKLLH